MRRSLLPSLLIPALAVTCPANDQIPESIRDLEAAYHKFCTKRGEALFPPFSKKLLALQQQAVNQSDFEKAKQIQSLLASFKKDILSPPSTSSVNAFFIGKRWVPERPNAGTHYVDSDFRLFEENFKQRELLPINQWVDTRQSSQEILIFTSEPSRIWLKRDDTFIIQVYMDATVDWLKVRDTNRNIAGPAGDDLKKLQQEFRTEYEKMCTPLTQKYLEALGKRQKQLVQVGNMNEAITIHEYIKKISSGGRQVGELLKGTWKSKNGALYDFSNKSRAAVKKPDGSLDFYLNYTSSSPKGEWKMARTDRRNGKDTEFIIFPVREKLYIVKNKPDNFLSILTRVSGS